MTILLRGSWIVQRHSSTFSQGANLQHYRVSALPSRGKTTTHTKAHELSPVPVSKFVVHCITPITRALILRAATTLEPEPRPFWAFHIPPPRSRFVVQRKVGSALLTVCSKVKFRNHVGDDAVIQTFGVVERKFLQPFAKVSNILTHNIVRGHLVWFEVMSRASNNNVVDVGISGEV